MVWRGTLVREIFENNSDIKDVVMKETISRPKMPEAAPEVVEAEEPAETEETKESEE
jgi:hypothetical protein